MLSVKQGGIRIIFGVIVMIPPEIEPRSPGPLVNTLTIMPMRLILCLHTVICPLTKRLECSPIAREIGVQSQVESYQRLKIWYLMPPFLTLSIIMYGSRVKWSNSSKGVAPFPTPWCSSYGCKLLLNGFKSSKWLNNPVWSIDGTLRCSTLSCQGTP